jgi:hypothetical protein
LCLNICKRFPACPFVLAGNIISLLDKFYFMDNVNQPPLSLGEQRVRTSFNPSNDGLIDKIKQKSAELINLCEDLKAKDARLASLAQTNYEDAAMWAVKAATA